jgi:tetrahydromethanopterin S-methyltransferase subunit D
LAELAALLKNDSASLSGGSKVSVLVTGMVMGFAPGVCMLTISKAIGSPGCGALIGVSDLVKKTVYVLPIACVSVHNKTAIGLCGRNILSDKKLPLLDAATEPCSTLVLRAILVTFL